MGARYTAKEPQDVNLMTLFERFGSDEKCRAYLEGLRWPDGLVCPSCQSTSVARVPSRNQYDCNSCRYKYSVLAGTIFHDTKLPLSKWFAAVYLMVESRKGISANQMKRTLSVSYKTAWYLCHRIRAAMGSVEKPPLSGIVEADETYIIGGKRHDGRGSRNTRGPQADKTIVIGAMQRGGNIRLRVATTTDKRTLHGFLHDVADEAEAIYTDQHASYVGIADENTRHESVNHSKDEWVRGQVHTNTAESVWSLFQRSIIGSYHHINAYHMPAYLDEMEWRFNGRNNPYLFRDTMLALIHSGNLPYSELVG